MSSQPKKEPNARSRRAARACARCHSRKVRCDGSITGFPCTNCRLDGRSCTLHSGKRDKEKQMLKAIARERGLNHCPTPNTGTKLHPQQTGLTFVRSQTALRVPIQEVLDIFTKHYFLYVHPCLPVVDEAVFWRKYRSVDASAGKISTLLFQAMLFAASPFVPVETVKECGYDSLISARDDLYRRAKRLYETGVEKDRLVISQACLLLTYYTTDAERSNNSRWLRIAIRYAKKERAHIYHHLPQTGLGPGRRTSDLKRLWWCCMIRDRIISLGMRRPIQITPDQFDLHQLGLSFHDLEEECYHSEVYTPDTKIALCRILASLCHLVVAVTDLIMLVYPTTQGMPFSLADRQIQLDRLEETKFALLDWELSWVANPDGKEYYIHPSLTLYTNLCAIYFQSARIALCNRICLLIGYNTYLSDETDLCRIEACRAELATAIRSTADNVKQLLLNGVADKLPISAVAYTLLPQILLSIQTQLSTTPEDKQLHEVMLVFFTEAFRFLRSQYYMSLIFAVSWKALELCRPASPAPLPSSDLSNTSNASSSSSSSSNSSNGNQLVLKPPFFTDLTANDLYCHPNLFQLKLTEYIRLLSYVDEFMSLRRAPGFEDLIYPSPAVQLQLHMSTNSNSQSHPRSYSQSSSSTSASSIPQRAAITAAAAATTDSPHDSSTIYSGDGETEDSTSPRWTEDYFWVYFGEKELEGESPQTTTATSTTTTTNPTTTISNGSSSNRSSSNSDSSSSTEGSNMPDHEERDSSGLGATSGGSPHCISSSPYDKSVRGSDPAISVKNKGKEKCSEGPRADTLQNMLDCLPLLGE